jgi:hypothetical protein
MCKFYSAIVMKNGDLLHNENLTSHEDLIDLFGINDTQTNCDKFVRVEFTPDEEKDYFDIEKYKLNIDEETTPKWFEKHREYTTERLKEFVSKRIITTDKKILTGGLYVVKDCIIGKLKVATVVYLQGTVQQVRDGGTVQEVRDGGIVQQVRGGGTVQEVWGGGTVQQVWNGGTVQEVRGGGTVQEVWNGGTVQQVRDGGTVQEVRDGGTVQEVWDGGTVQEVRDGGTVQQVWDGGTVQQVWDGGTVNGVKK